MCCIFCQRVKVFIARLRGAKRRGDWWILDDRVALLDPSKFLK
jgi:hypothetical protein